MVAVEDVVDDAARFIKPLLDKGPHDGPSESRRSSDLGSDAQLVQLALGHLEAIHAADAAKDVSEPYDGALAGVVYGLLDLITALGIIPSLSSGLLFSKRPRSVLVPSLGASSHRDIPLLARVVKALLAWFKQEGAGVQPLVTQRLLPDIISGLSELAFSPAIENWFHNDFRPCFDEVIKSSPTSRILPIFTCFLQQDIPAWFREQISRELAVVPARPHGVRHTIEFVSLSYLSQNSSRLQDQSTSLSQIPIPLEAISQTSRLLASAPVGMELDDWLSKLAPQLWSLLDGEGGFELSRAAGRIIASGFLGRRSTGAPGAPGWELFAKPIVQTIRPEANYQSLQSHLTHCQSGGIMTIVEDSSLLLALKRLFAIISSYSHPGLTRRLVHPVLLPLWGLLQFASERVSKAKVSVFHFEPQWVDLPRQILSRYLSTAFDPVQVETIVDHLFWDGPLEWTFGMGSNAGVEICRRVTNAPPGDFKQLMAQLESLEGHLESFLSLLSETHVEDAAMGDLFLRISRRWLSSDMENDAPENLPPDGSHDVSKPLRLFMAAKVSQGMATKFQTQFARHPRHIMELVIQLVESFVRSLRRDTKGHRSQNTPNLLDLGRIVNLGGSQNQDISAIGAAGSSESEEMATFALSILNVLVSSPDFSRTKATENLISGAVTCLQDLISDEKHLSEVVLNASKNLIAILDPPHNNPETSQKTEGLRKIETALQDLKSSEPQDRVFALSTLRTVIEDPETFPFLDIPSTTHLILAATITETESFVHSAGIATMARLAAISPRPVLRILIEAYVDTDENSLGLVKEPGQATDFRLRIGEVLDNFTKDDSFWDGASKAEGRHQAAKFLSEAGISVGSRRGQRSKTLAKRHDILELERLKREEAEAAWGGPVPDLFSDEENESPSQKSEREFLTRILEGWESTGAEEDVRVRSSALSILGCVLENRLAFVSQLTIEAALQLVATTLVLETKPEKAILRRAAVLVIMGLLKGLENLIETEAACDDRPRIGLKQGEKLETLLKWVQDEDTDDLVKSHTQDVLDGLEALRIKQWFGLNHSGPTKDLGLNVEGGLRGLKVNPLSTREKEGQKSLLVEEVE